VECIYLKACITLLSVPCMMFAVLNRFNVLYTGLLLVSYRDPIVPVHAHSIVLPQTVGYILLSWCAKQ